MSGKQCLLIMLAELANFNQTQLFSCRYVCKQAQRVPTFLEKNWWLWNS